MVDISWTDAARPVISWLKRNLPAMIFRYFYASGDMQQDVKVFCSAEDAPEVHLPRPLQVPALHFSVSVLNASPYLDARVLRFHCFLVAGSEDSTGDPFATFDRWSGPDLPKGMTINVSFLLNEYQLRIIETWVRGEAWISASAIVWLETKIGAVHISKVLHLDRPRTG